MTTRPTYLPMMVLAAVGSLGVACGGTDPVTPPPPVTPVLEITTRTLAAGRVDVEYDASVAATGGDARAYTWTVKAGQLPAGISLSSSGTSARLSGTPTMEGTFDVTLDVADAAGQHAQRSFLLVIEPQELEPLSITTTSLSGGFARAPYQAMITAAGSSGQGHEWTVVSGALPAGLTLSREGSPSTVISGTPTADGTSTFTVRVRDSLRQMAEKSFTITIAPEPVALTIVTPSELFGGRLGAPYVSALVARGGSGSGYTWAVTAGALSPGLTLSAAGELSGTPTRAGESTFTARVTDGAGATAEREFRLTIQPVGPPVRILDTSLPAGRVGVAYAVELRGTGGTSSGFVWSISQGALTPGLTLSAMGTPTSQLRGTPTASGDFTFTVRLTDALGQQGEVELTIHVEPAIIPVRIVTSSIASGVVGEPYEARVTAADGFGSYNWLVTAGALPGGLALDLAGTPSARIRGTPVQAGTFTATITVFDQNNVTASRPFTLTVAPPPNPVRIVTTTLPNAGLNAAYSQQIVATAGSDAGFTWSVVQGSLPPGINLAPMGTPATMVSGSATASGLFGFTVQVVDSAGGVATQAFTISVGTALVVETTSLPLATIGQLYTATITASGGSSAGYAWSISQGSLPTGLTLRDTGTPFTTIRGTPTQFGARTFEVELRDSGNNVSRRTYTISVRGPQRYVAWVGDTDVNDDTSVFLVDISAGTGPGAPIQVSPLAPGLGDASTSATLTQFSPDNSRIAFRGDFATDGVEELWVVNLSGPSPATAVVVSAPMVLNGDIISFAWSPDSRWLAYLADQDVDAVNELYVVDVTGAVPSTPVRVSGTMVLNGDVLSNVYGFSPDSSWLYYNADQEVDTSNYLYVVDLSGPTPGLGVRVHPDLQGAAADVVTTGIFFTPDSSRILYVADQETVDIDELWMVGLAGRVPGMSVKLSGTLTPLGDVVASDLQISPAGTHVAYVADAETDAVSELYTVNLTTTPPGAPVKVSSATMVLNGDVQLIAWSPDGTRLLYLADQDVDLLNELYVVGVGGALPLTHTRVNALLPPTGGVVASNLTGFGWSPDGRWIAYRADPLIDGAFHLYLVPMSASGPGVAAQVSTHNDISSDIEAFVFSPDGRRIAYRGDNIVVARDDIYVSDLSGATPSPGVAVAVPTVTLGNALDQRWVGNSRILVRGDFVVDNDFGAFFVDLDAPVVTAVQLHPPIPLNGDVSAIFTPF